MKPSVYFCGEAVVDFLEDKKSPEIFSRTLGGSAFFSAIGAKNAATWDSVSCNVGFIGPISTDGFGQRFFEKLVQNGVDMHGVARVGRHTTLAMVTIKPGEENLFSFYGQGTSVEGTTRGELPAKQYAGAQNIFCFGGISTVFEPARFAWVQFAKEQAAQSVVYFDLNVRPALVKDLASYREIVREWAQVAHIVKASDADIATAYPDKSIKEVAEMWLSEGAKVAVITAGGKGSFAFTRNGESFAGSAPLIVASTVGAGDNFNSGFAVNLVKENHITPAAVGAISNEALQRILAGANQTAVRHLISIGAKENPERPGNPDASLKPCP